MGSLEKKISVLDSDDLRDLLRYMYDEIGQGTADRIIDDFLRKKLQFKREEVIDDVCWALGTYDDYICFECSIKGVSDEECFSEEKASSMIAEKIFEEFYDKAEMMLELGMRDEAIRYISSIAEGVHRCYKEKSALITGLAGDFSLRYSDILERSLESDDILKGFGKK